MDYTTLFRQALGPGASPYAYQIDLAHLPLVSRAIRVPTGAGKTAAVILAWIWKRMTDPDNTPRRLAYMLPMRALVRQTYSVVKEWIANLGLDLDIGVYLLMGGEIEEDWETRPEHPAILIGTQDMLLSRALNRGYAMSRYRWPVHFGLLNNDTLTVCDEVQLMSSGLATSIQMQAWRDRIGRFGPCVTWWMSATLHTKWLQTVDYPAEPELLELSPDDQTHPAMEARFRASKPIHRIGAGEAELINAIETHHVAGTLTLVVVNTVERAQAVYLEIQKRSKKTKILPEILLLHSRFRGKERDEKMANLKQAAERGGVVISTQVIEAGVDISCRTLITEIAPWASLVQRFGRCNRLGEWPTEARILVADVVKASPYIDIEIAEARGRLDGLQNASLQVLTKLAPPEGEIYTHVIRRKDLQDLFDTTADLSGSDLDISRYVREGEDRDAQVYWRRFESEPGEQEQKPFPEELCSVPASSLEAITRDRDVFRYDTLEDRWKRIFSVVPGQVYLLPSTAGAYSDIGWDPKSKAEVSAHERTVAGDSYDRDRMSSGPRRSIAEHTNNVVHALNEIAAALPLTESARHALNAAARWHDRGKAHHVFQNAMPEGTPNGLWAKAPGQFRRYERQHFRHELASAIAALQTGGDFEGTADLVAFLIASHHGKIRVSIRSMPGEKRPAEPSRPFARGIHEGDSLPETDLGSGITAPAVTLSLDTMRIGVSERGERSWAERILALRDALDLGLFRLAYLEAVLRSADRRASETEGDEIA